MIVTATQGKSEPTPRAAASKHGEHSRKGLEALSPKERQVLSLLSFGYANKQIATMLLIAESTIKAHVRNIFDVLGCTNRVQAALIAFSVRNEIDPSEILLSNRAAPTEDVPRLSSVFDHAMFKNR